MRRATSPNGEGAGVEIWRRDLGGIRMEQLTADLRQSRELVSTIEARDLRRGFTHTLLVLLAVTWLAGLVPLLIVAHRITRPVGHLTSALSDLADGDWTTVESEWMFHPSNEGDPAFDPADAIAFWDVTNRQDWDIVERSQLGVSSRRYAPGPYSPRESIPAAWDREYLRQMGRGRQEPEA